MFKFYKPIIKRVVFDVVVIVINFIIIFAFMPFTTKNPLQKYFIPALIFTFVWLLTAYFFGRYKRSCMKYFVKTTLKLVYISFTVFVIFGGFILIQPRSPYSQHLLITVILGIFIIEYISFFIYFSIRYAVSYDNPKIKIEKRKPSPPLPSEDFHPQSVIIRSDAIKKNNGVKILNYLEKNTNLYNTGTSLITSASDEELQEVVPFKYSTIIQMTKLNNLRGINNMFDIINMKLPDNGRFVCCYKTLSSTKKDIYTRHPNMKGRMIYFSHFVFHRVLPKLTLTRRFYYDITDGKKRTLSKTEVLGRLRYCGFRIINQSKVNDLNFVVAERESTPNPTLKKNYGTLIKLKRVGKNGQLFHVYKFRTMHPYAEFIQDYVYEKSNLATGGKFKRDVRVTNWGHFMRKYWLDELPMLLNLLKGDMKLVGVRPISKHYFSLYNEELQSERIKHKPGLLPPFYADMPKTLEDIQNSELKYLYECNKKGTFITDVKYFFLILRNILFKKVRSA